MKLFPKVIATTTLAAVSLVGGSGLKAGATTPNYQVRSAANCPSVILGYTALGLPMGCYFADVDVLSSGSESTTVYMDTNEWKWTKAAGYSEVSSQRWYATCLPNIQLGNPFCGGGTVWLNVNTGSASSQNTFSIEAPNWTPQAGVYHVLQNVLYFKQGGKWVVGANVNYLVDPAGNVSAM